VDEIEQFGVGEKGVLLTGDCELVGGGRLVAAQLRCVALPQSVLLGLFAGFVQAIVLVRNLLFLRLWRHWFGLTLILDISGHGMKRLIFFRLLRYLRIAIISQVILFLEIGSVGIAVEGVGLLLNHPK
jgi:hypothetical protein